MARDKLVERKWFASRFPEMLVYLAVNRTSGDCRLSGPEMLQRSHFLSHTVVIIKVLKRFEYGLSLKFKRKYWLVAKP